MAGKNRQKRKKLQYEKSVSEEKRQRKCNAGRRHIHNRKIYDSSSKIIFGNAQLCSQFLSNYMDMPMLRNIRPEDIEDVSERYVPMFTEERYADTVKRVKISENNTLFFISLIEHKTKVDYNVSMQLLRYMVYIWEDYEKEMERAHKGITKTRDFKYPPILPIVYYEGSGEWTAVRNFQDRVFLPEVFGAFTPRFLYKLIQLHKYSMEDLVDKNDELSFVMLINRLQGTEEFREMNLPETYLKNLSDHTTDELMAVIVKVISVMLRHLNVPEEEIEEFTGQVKEWKMGELFEHFRDYDLPAARKKAQEEGRNEGRAEGIVEGRSKGEERMACLVRILMENDRLDDLRKITLDKAYRETLYLEHGLT